MRTYAVKEIFGPTVQGEGSLTGTVTHFLRFAGCNQWDGRAETRAASACPFCDTDFFGGTKMSAEAIVEALADIGGATWVTVSGGEPMLQFDAELASALRAAGFKIAIETNGTKHIGLVLGALIDHVTMSPKVPPEEVRLSVCDDIKVLVPHPDPRITPEAFQNFYATRRYVQPVNNTETINGESVARALAACYELAKNGHDWRLSLQLHKVIGVK